MAIRHSMVVAATASSVVFAAMLALGLAERADAAVVAVLGGAALGLSISVPVLLLAVVVLVRARSSTTTSSSYTASPLSGAVLEIRRPSPPREVSAPIITTAADHRTHRRDDDDDVVEPVLEPDPVVFATRSGSGIIRARRDDVLQVMRQWPAPPRRTPETWRGSATRYTSTCSFLAAHKLLTQRGRGWEWSERVRRGHDLAEFVSGLDAAASVR